MLRRKSNRTASATEPALPATAQLYELIATRAYEMYELRGSGAGDALSDWLAAESEIMATLSTPRVEAAEAVADARPLIEDVLPNDSSGPTPVPGSRKKSAAVRRSTDKQKGAHP